MTTEPPPDFRVNMQNHSFNPVLQAELEVTLGPVFSLDWSPDGRMLASSGYGLIKVWDAALQREIATIQGDTAPTGDAAIDAVLHKEMTTHQGHNHYVWGLNWSPDGTILASAGLTPDGQDGFVKLWNAASWQNIATLETGAWAFCVSWSPDGKRLAVGTGSFSDPSKPETFSGKSQVWDMETRELVRELAVSSSLISTAWSPDGHMLAIGQWDGRLTFWDGESESALKSLVATSERSDVNGLAWSPNGRMLATAQQDGKVRIWNPETGEILETLEGHKGPLRGVTWSPDGRLLASASTGEDGEIRVWQMKDGQMLACLPPESLPIWSLAWSPDGKWLAAGTGVLSEPRGANVLIYKLVG